MTCSIYNLAKDDGCGIDLNGRLKQGCYVERREASVTVLLVLSGPTDCVYNSDQTQSEENHSTCGGKEDANVPNLVHNCQFEGISFCKHGKIGCAKERLKRDERNGCSSIRLYSLDPWSRLHQPISVSLLVCIKALNWKIIVLKSWHRSWFDILNTVADEAFHPTLSPVTVVFFHFACASLNSLLLDVEKFASKVVMSFSSRDELKLCVALFSILFFIKSVSTN